MKTVYFKTANLIYLVAVCLYISFAKEIAKNKKPKFVRIECDVNQEDLANNIDVTKQTIGLTEPRNYNPTLKLYIAISKALNKTLDDYFLFALLIIFIPASIFTTVQPYWQLSIGNSMGERRIEKKLKEVDE